MTREKYPTRRFLIRSAVQKEYACAVIHRLPEDKKNPIEVVIREYTPRRNLDQNALMWAGVLEDISQQVCLNDRTYIKDDWHEYFKQEFLPEQFDPELTMEGYQKWRFLPNGDRILDKDNASTTKLTKKGFAQYLEQIYAFGVEHGVQFGAADAA